MNKFIVDMDIIRDNILKTKIKDVKYCAMVKANAYGHGIVKVAQSIEDLADMFGVANIDEAKVLRHHTNKDILVTGVFEQKDILIATKNNIILSLSNFEQLDWITKNKEKIRIHIKINTGMNRYGFNPYDIDKILKALKNYSHISFEGVFSHLSNINDKRRTYTQISIFKNICSLLPPNIIKHLATIEACESYNNINFDMIRAGIGMYGYSNITKPAITIKSKIIHSFDVKKGSFIGYGNTYKARKNMRVGIVPLGYYDGINFHLSNKGKVFVGDKLCNIVGRVCMDCFMVDKTGVSSDEVEVFNSKLNANYWAKLCKTINYEILTNLKHERLKYIKKLTFK